MMSLRWVWCGLVVLGVGWGSGAARAQFQDQFVPPPPGLSPYLNLFRQGNSPAINYFDIVRPQLQNQTAIQGLQQQQTTFQQQLRQTAPQVSTGQGTAKVPGYMTHGKYFGTAGTIAAGNGPTHRSLSDRAANTRTLPANNTVPNRTPGTGVGTSPFGGSVPNAATSTGLQTPTGIGPLTPGLSPNYINPYNPAPFNPYRGF